MIHLLVSFFRNCDKICENKHHDWSENIGFRHTGFDSFNQRSMQRLDLVQICIKIKHIK